MSVMLPKIVDLKCQHNPQRPRWLQGEFLSFPFPALTRRILQISWGAYVAKGPTCTCHPDPDQKKITHKHNKTKTKNIIPTSQAEVSIFGQKEPTGMIEMFSSPPGLPTSSFLMPKTCSSWKGCWWDSGFLLKTVFNLVPDRGRWEDLGHPRVL